MNIANKTPKYIEMNARMDLMTVELISRNFQMELFPCKREKERDMKNEMQTVRRSDAMQND